MDSDHLEVWRCADCDVTWIEATMKPCWSCGQRPTHVKPYRPSYTNGQANMHCSGDLTKREPR